MAQTPGGGILKNVVHIFCYGGLDGRWVYPYFSGPVKTVIDTRRPNIWQAPLSGPSNFNQNGRANPIGFQNHWQELIQAVETANCGIALLTEYGVTEGYSFSHEIAQNMFHNGNNIENYATVHQGWLARIIDAYQMQQFTTWGFRVTEPTFFNSEFAKPLSINNVDNFKFESRNFATVYCSTDTASPDYMVGCPTQNPGGWQGRESHVSEDILLMRKVMKDMRDAPKSVQGPLVDQFVASLADLDPTVKLMQDGVKPIRNLLPETDFKAAASTGGLSNFQAAIRELAATLVYVNTGAAQPVRDSAHIFCAGIGGWDGHFGINNAYNGLVPELANGLKGLVRALATYNLLNTTAILVHSEFGRTTAQNGSSGTDHAGASHGLLIGGRVRRQAVGPDPILSEAQNQNHFTPQLPMTAVLRQVLAAAGFTGPQMTAIIPPMAGETDLNLFT